MSERGTGTPRQRQLRRANRRLSWTPGSYRLLQIATYSYRPSVRRETVVKLLKTRQWRLAATVVVMPDGYVLATQDEHARQREEAQHGNCRPARGAG